MAFTSRCSSLLYRPFYMSAAIICRAMIKAKAAAKQLIHDPIAFFKEIIERVVGRETMKLIELVLQTIKNQGLSLWGIPQLMATTFTIFMCQWLSGPDVLPTSGKRCINAPGSDDARIMKIFSRCSVYAKAAYCKRQEGFSGRRPLPGYQLGESIFLRSYHVGSDLSEVYKQAQSPKSINEIVQTMEVIRQMRTNTRKTTTVQQHIALQSKHVGPYEDKMYVGADPVLEHFVATDTDFNRVILSFKGTSNVEDMVKDLDAGYFTMSYLGGTYKVHKGMWEAAKKFLKAEQTLEHVRDAMLCNPTFTLTIVGHSLGGSVAALVAVLLSDRTTLSGRFVTNETLGIGERRIECFAIGPGACMDSALADLTKDMIHTLVNGDDVVPYLSLGVLEDLCDTVQKIHRDNSLNKITLDLLRAWPPGSHSEDTILGHLIYLLPETRSERLVPPGRVFVIVYNEKHDVEGVEEVLDVKDRFGYINLRQKLRFMKEDHSLGSTNDIAIKLSSFCD